MSTPAVIDTSAAERRALIDLPHHEAADLFPMLSESELTDFTQSVKRNGLIEPVWLYQDLERGLMLLDGRNRLTACSRAGVEPRSQMYTGDDPVGFSVSLNCRRRHLSTVQRAKVANAMLPLYAAEAARKQRTAGVTYGRGKPSKLEAKMPQALGQPPKREPQARDLAAKQVGISGRSVAEYKQVSEQAPDLLPAVDAGEMKLREACRVIRDRKRAAATRVETGPASKAKGRASSQTRDQRAEIVASMAAQGHTRHQAAVEVGIGLDAVNDITRDYGITFPADVTKKTRRVDSARVVRETVSTLEGVLITLPLVDMADLDPREAQHWTASLDQSIRALNRFNKKIKDIVR